MRAPITIAILFLTLLTFSVSQASAQGIIFPRRVAVLPAQCNPSGSGGNSVLVFKWTTPNAGLYQCTATNTWTLTTAVAGLTPFGMLYANASGAAASTGAATDGQLLIGRSGNTPVLGSLNGTASEITVTNAAGSVTLSLATILVHQAGSRFVLTDISDTSKRFNFLAAGITTGTTRSITVPDANITLPIFSQQATFTGLTAARSYVLPDSNQSFVYGSGTENQLAKFSATGSSVTSAANLSDNGTTVEIGTTEGKVVRVGGFDPSGVKVDTNNTILGDWDSTGNSTAITIDDAASTVTIGAASGTVFAGPFRITGGTSITFIESATASLNFAQANANTCETLTVAVGSAADGDVVTIGVPHALANHNTTGTFFAWVSAAGTVSVRRCVVTADGSDPAAATVRAQITQF